MRTLLATAPPRYPVRRIAPKIAVLGIAYRIVLTRRTIPRGRMTSCGYPIFVVASTTWCSIASFDMASNSMNNTVRPLMIRPAQSEVLDPRAIVCVFVDVGSVPVSQIHFSLASASGCLEMFVHTLEAQPYHLPKAHFHAQIALGERVESSHQRPLCLTGTFHQRNRIDRRRRSGISIGVLDRSPHQTFRSEDLFKNAVDREACPIGGLHHVMPRAALPHIHFAHRAGESGSAIPLRDMFGIRDGGPHK